MKTGKRLQEMTKEEHCMRTEETGDLSSTDHFKLEAVLEGDRAASTGRPLHQEDIAILPERLT
jgi:hypothetical protein